MRLRGSIARDRQTRDIENVYGVEGVARLGLTQRLLAGLDTLGVNRKVALRVIRAAALDSVPPNRRAAYDYLTARTGKEAASTPTIAEALALPTSTVRRVLEELAAYGLIDRRPQGQGKADLWAALDWERELQEPKDWSEWERAE